MTRIVLSLILDPIPIKFLPEGKKSPVIFLTSVKEGDCSYAWEFIIRHCANGISHIKDIYFDQSYSTLAHADSFIINIAIVDMNILTARILDVSNTFHNTNVPIYEKGCFSPPPYYLDWFEISYPNVPLNRYDGPFFLQYM